MLAVLAGLCLALIVYYAIYSGLAAYREKNHPPCAHPEEECLNPEQGVDYDMLGNPIRYCPVCGRILEPGEKVLGIVIKAEPKDKLLVKGCRTCNALPAASSMN